MNNIIRENLRRFSKHFELKETFDHSTFLITGGSGLIGSTLIKCLLALSPSIRIIAPVRDKKKAIEILGDHEAIRFVDGDLSREMSYDFPDIDYIVHAAAPTSSKFFIENPVETIDSIISITKQLLDYASKNPIKAFVFLSSLEIYGQRFERKLIREKDQGSFNLLDVRSSYPLAKQLAENLCVAYWHEYKVPVRIARLTQTTGPGVSKNDNRVIVQFVRCAVNNEDIILHTTGESSRPYCYTFDAIEAILYILANGINGEAYNVANESTYISAKDLANMVKEVLNPNLNIKYDIRSDLGYAPTTQLNLSTKALQALGWTPRYDLKDIMMGLYDYLNKL